MCKVYQRLFFEKLVDFSRSGQYFGLHITLVLSTKTLLEESNMFDVLMTLAIEPDECLRSSSLVARKIDLEDVFAGSKRYRIHKLFIVVNVPFVYPGGFFGCCVNRSCQLVNPFEHIFLF